MKKVNTIVFLIKGCLPLTSSLLAISVVGGASGLSKASNLKRVKQYQKHSNNIKTGESLYLKSLIKWKIISNILYLSTKSVP